MGSDLIYCENWLHSARSDEIFDLLREELPWQKEVVRIFGKTMHLNREVCLMGDGGIEYTYAAQLKKAIPWHPSVFALKQEIEKERKCTFNACLLNWYHSGEDGMGWHSDDEKELVAGSTIASVSLGAVRKFQWRSKSGGEISSLELKKGSLLLMNGNFQRDFKHALPKTKKSKAPRLNLTFRLFKS